MTKRKLLKDKIADRKQTEDFDLGWKLARSFPTLTLKRFKYLIKTVVKQTKNDQPKSN